MFKYNRNKILGVLLLTLLLLPSHMYAELVLNNNSNDELLAEAAFLLLPSNIYSMDNLETSESDDTTLEDPTLFAGGFPPDPGAVPEPSTYLLCLIGLALFSGQRLRK